MALDEDKPAKIAIARDKDPALFVGDAKQLDVICLRQTELSNWNNIVTQATQEDNRGGIDILIGEEIHDVIAT